MCFVWLFCSRSLPPSLFHHRLASIQDYFVLLIFLIFPLAFLWTLFSSMCWSYSARSVSPPLSLFLFSLSPPLCALPFLCALHYQVIAVIAFAFFCVKNGSYSATSIQHTGLGCCFHRGFPWNLPFAFFVSSVSLDFTHHASPDSIGHISNSRRFNSFLPSYCDRFPSFSLHAHSSFCQLFLTPCVHSSSCKSCSFVSRLPCGGGRYVWRSKVHRHWGQCLFPPSANSSVAHYQSRPREVFLFPIKSIFFCNNYANLMSFLC